MVNIDGMEAIRYDVVKSTADNLDLSRTELGSTDKYHQGASVTHLPCMQSIIVAGGMDMGDRHSRLRPFPQMTDAVWRLDLQTLQWS